MDLLASIRSRTSALAAALTLLPAALTLLAAAPALARKTAANWDASQQRIVVRAGLMSEASPKNFAGAAPLTPEAERVALAALAARAAAEAEAVEAEGTPAPAPQPAVSSTATMTVTRFDALLVEALGLSATAAHVQATAAAAGLRPPSYFGTEVVARYLGLRYDHPSGEDSLELYPWNPITRAEAAHSFAVVLEQGGWAVQDARETLEAFSLPHYSAAQLRVLRIAVSKIGMPYVWGGTTDGTEDGLEHGGYDCSGFAWRVYKVSGLSWGAKILGRTAAEQAGEIPKSARVRLQQVQPADLLFFGSAHFGSKATEANVIHEGVALSGEWAIHSSGQGVYVLPLDSGWLAKEFTWGRRVL
ncbi:MAG TPA: NlpC/P60 family protein [Solirubrobacteraceae bacterium]|nr:NlpC/P60 family protein [Solirubrobacteraceae bacterium]